MVFFALVLDGLGFRSWERLSLVVNGRYMPLDGGLIFLTNICRLSLVLFVVLEVGWSSVLAHWSFLSWSCSCFMSLIMGDHCRYGW
jgi:hypothetical protein